MEGWPLQQEATEEEMVIDTGMTAAGDATFAALLSSPDSGCCTAACGWRMGSCDSTCMSSALGCCDGCSDSVCALGCPAACLITHFAFWPCVNFEGAFGIDVPIASTFASSATGTAAEGLIVAEVAVFLGFWALLGVRSSALDCCECKGRGVLLFRRDCCDEAVKANSVHFFVASFGIFTLLHIHFTFIICFANGAKRVGVSIALSTSKKTEQ